MGTACRRLIGESRVLFQREFLPCGLDVLVGFRPKAHIKQVQRAWVASGPRSRRYENLRSGSSRDRYSLRWERALNLRQRREGVYRGEYEEAGNRLAERG